MSTASSSRVLVIVPCGKQKVWSKDPSAGPVPAQDAYVSNYFRLCRRYAETFSDKWVIFSGKYGVVDPHSLVLGDYDTKISPSESLRRLLRTQLRRIVSPGFTRAISLCGAQYSRFLNAVLKDFGLTADAPLDGIRIGTRQRLLKKCLESGKPL